MVGYILATSGRVDEAIAEFQEALKLVKISDDATASLACAYAAAGKRSEALQLVASLEEASKRRYVASWWLAMVYAGLGDADRAFALLDKGYDERPSNMSDIKVDPRMASLRSDPRYHELLRRMGLPE